MAKKKNPKKQPDRKALAAKKPAKKRPAVKKAGARLGWTWGPARPKPTISVYQFRISLLGLHPPIWRRIQVQDCFLDEFHDHVQEAMGWTNSHLHIFDIDGFFYGRPRGFGPDGEDQVIDASQTLLSTVVPKASPGVRQQFACRYTYDLGDNWDHMIEFEGTVEPTGKPRPGQ
jgi:hypothetical protein